MMSKCNRKAKASWFSDNQWLRYSESDDSIYCAPCKLFGSKDTKEKTLGVTPVKDWSNAGKLVQRHLASATHELCLKSADSFISVMDGKAKSVTRQISSQYDQIVSRNRKILGIIIETIVLCGNQNMALRGSEDDRSNFIAILKYRSKDNEILREHLEFASKTKEVNKTTYLSPDIQNEIIDICGNMISDDIISACNSAPCFAFIADEATDVATIEQMALCLRFYDENEMSIREEFIGFAECKSTTGEALTNAFLDNLREKGVTVDKMRGQGYDGAANMSGKYRGVQARIREIIPGAVYTHCKAHNLNLSIVHACKEPLVRNLMNTLQEIAFMFDYSGKKLGIFKEHLSEDETAKDNMEGRQKLKTLCETRWASRSDALYTFKAAYSTVDAALDELATEHNDTKAGPYKTAIEQFSFIITLITAEHILSSLVPLSNLLQKKDCDLSVALDESRIVIRLLSDERNDIEVWNALYAAATDLAATVESQPTMPRNRGSQRNRPNAPADNPSEYWRLNMYLPFLDHLIGELNVRLLSPEPRFCAQNLIPTKAAQLDEATGDMIFNSYSDEITLSQCEFRSELNRWKTKWTGNADKVPHDLQETLNKTNKDLYPGIYIILNIFACMPVSTATAERSFSTMRRVKTYLRNTMTTKRLSGLGLLNVYREKEIQTERVLDAFSRKKERKWALLFQ